MIEISPSKAVQVVFLAREGRIGSAELHGFIDAMNEEEKAHLTAIAWIGRGAFEPEDYADAVRTAYSAVTVPVEDYLTGMPHLPENIEAGLEALGIDVSGEEEDLL